MFWSGQSGDRVSEGPGGAHRAEGPLGDPLQSVLPQAQATSRSCAHSRSSEMCHQFPPVPATPESLPVPRPAAPSLPWATAKLSCSRTNLITPLQPHPARLSWSMDKVPTGPTIPHAEPRAQARPPHLDLWVASRVPQLPPQPSSKLKCFHKMMIQVHTTFRSSN